MTNRKSSARKKVRKYSYYEWKLRALISEFTPYETSIGFSIFPFYRLISSTLKTDCSDCLTFRITSWAQLIQLKSCLKKIWIVDDSGQEIKLEKDSFSGGRNLSAKITLANLARPTEPLKYEYSGNGTKTRTLSIMHPQNMLYGALFYSRFETQILVHTSRSSRSLRRPVALSTKDYAISPHGRSHQFKRLGHRELQGDEYRFIHSYFRYEPFNYVARYFESETHTETGRNFRFLDHLDIAACFDSIYTHSIEWGLYGFYLVKKNTKGRKTSFGGEFDKFISGANYGETRGIIIGPEVSRVFAEIYLQEIDLKVIQLAKERNLALGDDYDFFRYVDDYFVYSNDESTADRLTDIIRLALSEYKMRLNDVKRSRVLAAQLTERSKFVLTARQKVNSVLKFIDDPASENVRERSLVGGHGAELVNHFREQLGGDTLADQDFVVSTYLRALELRLTRVLSKVKRSFSERSATAPESAQVEDALTRILKDASYIADCGQSASNSFRFGRIIIAVFDSCDCLNPAYKIHRLRAALYSILKKSLQSKTATLRSATNLALMKAYAYKELPSNSSAKVVVGDFLDEALKSDINQPASLIYLSLLRTIYDWESVPREYVEKLVSQLCSRLKNLKESQGDSGAEYAILMSSLLSFPEIYKYRKFLDLLPDEQRRWLKWSHESGSKVPTGGFIRWQDYDLLDELLERRLREVY